MLAYIWAEDLTGGIGVDGHLPWHLKADLKRFKEKTMNHPMIMDEGRLKAYREFYLGESISC